MSPWKKLLLDRLSLHIANFSQMSEEQLLHRYAEGKWSIKEVIGHLIDCERIMAYRALRFARRDATSLPGFDENDYVPAGQFDKRSIESLLTEWQEVRQATWSLYVHLGEADLAFAGKANGLPATSNAYFYIIAAHQEHHINIINDRYLLS